MVKTQKMLGFTLIELLITIAIVSILASIVYPSYAQYVLTAKRSEAQSILLNLANKQELYYLDHRQYADELDADLGLDADPFITENGYYSVSTSSSLATADFTLEATAIGSQVADEECAKFTITHELAKSALTKAGATSDECWN